MIKNGYLTEAKVNVVVVLVSEAGISAEGVPVAVVAGRPEIGAG